MFPLYSPHAATTSFVLAETHALFLVRLGRAAASTFLREIVQSSTPIVRVSSRDEERARALVFQSDDEGFSYTDAPSFAVMERLGIEATFTFEHNLAQYGLTMIGPDRTP